MIALPRRVSIVEEAITALSSGIANQTWINFLPSERHLAEQLQISRPTLRLALAQLSGDGLIKVEQGRATKILKAPSTLSRHARAHTVAFVVMRPVTSLTGISILRECQAALQSAGYACEFHERPYAHSKKQIELLRDLIAARNDVVWISVSAEPAHQKIFEEMGARAIILGCAGEGITLPSVDVDYAAIAVHATKTFCRMGHRRIHAVLPQKPLAGDRIAERAIVEAAQKPDFAHMTWTFSRADDTSDSVCRALARQLSSAQPPTGIYATYGRHALTVLTYLSLMGRQVPRDISLLCRDDEESLQHVVPAIAAYKSDHQLEIRKIVRAVQLLAGGRARQPRSVFFIPKFEPRGTIGRCADGFRDHL